MKSNNDIRPKRQAFILTIWPQGEPAIWRGSLEQITGNRDYFQTVAQLVTLLQTHGWREANISIKEPKS